MQQVHLNVPDELAALLSSTVPMAVTFTLQSSLGGTMQVTMPVVESERGEDEKPVITLQ
jgi:hypothetical protein